MTKGWVFWLVAGLAVTGLAAAEFFSASDAVSRETVPAAPELRTMEGSVSDVDMTAPLPVLKVANADGRLVELSIDPLSTVVLQDRQATTVAQLEKGQKVKVSYQQKEGREVANAIEIMDPLPMPAVSDEPQPVPSPATPAS